MESEENAQKYYYPSEKRVNIEKSEPSNVFEYFELCIIISYVYIYSNYIKVVLFLNQT